VSRMRPPVPAPQSSPPPSGWRWAYPSALAGMIVVASGRSQVAGPPVVNIDKLVHFMVFGLLATTVVRSLGIKRFRMAILTVSLFGVADEFRQSFTPGRFVEFADWVADTAGAFTAVSLYVYWPLYRRLLETPLRLGPRRVNPAAPSAEATAKSASAT